MILIGLTGGIACGKSIVCGMLAKGHGIRIIDADAIVRELQQPGTPCMVAIAKRWPNCVDPTTNELRREELGRIIFADATARRALAKIMHGPIFRTIIKRIVQCWWETVWAGGKPRVVILDVPTLFETQVLTYLISNSVVVTCSEETQVERMMRRNGFSREVALERIHAQMPLERKREMAGYVVENDGDLAALQGSLEDCMRWMETQSSHRLTVMLCGAMSATVGIAVIGLRCIRWITML